MHRMNGWVLAGIAGLLMGCPENEPTPVPPSASNYWPAVPVEIVESPGADSISAGPQETCTFRTPLEPGIPGSPGNLIASDINPNGASELAVLMRKMVEDLRQVRQGILNGEPPAEYPTDHGRMRCTWPTDPGMRNAHYDGMAKNYLVTFSRLTGTKNAHEKRYDELLDGCVACHSQTCQGPIPLIESLRLPAQAP